MIDIASPELGELEREFVADVLDSGMLADGPEVRAFESEFAAYCDTAHGVATSNGTTALHAALVGLDIGPGDRVATTPFSFVATANAIRLAGAEPVFLDIDPETYNLDPETLEAALRDGVDLDAVLVVHLYGLSAAMTRFEELAAEYDLALVEDAAQAHGATYRGDPVGSFGDAACFSFYPTKNMTTGEGGMVVTDRDDVAADVSRFINHGRGDDDRVGYTHVEVGHNFRMTSLAAAIGRAQLTRLPEFVSARRANAAHLTAALADTPVVTPTEPDGRTHAYHQYTVRCGDREALRDGLQEAGVGSGVYYPTPIHRQPAYADVDHEAPIAERAAEEVLSLPVHPALTRDDLDRIVSAVRTNTEGQRP